MSEIIIHMYLKDPGMQLGIRIGLVHKKSRTYMEQIKCYKNFTPFAALTPELSTFWLVP